MKELNKERKNIDKKSFNALYVLRDLLSFEQFKKCENAHGRDLLALMEAFLFSGENHFRHFRH